MSDFELVRLSSLDSAAVEGFLAAPEATDRFRRAENAAYYEWLNGPGPNGEEAASWAALDGDRIVAALSAPLRRLWLGGRQQLTAKLEEMATDPAYRGRGLMRLVFERVKEDATSRGARVLMAGPTSPHSYPIFLERLGFSEPFQIINLVRPLRWPVVGRRGWPTDRGTSDRWALRPIEIEDADFGALAARVSADSGASVVKSGPYLEWRYGQHPDVYAPLGLFEHGTPVGLAVVKETRQRGLVIANVVELLAESGKARGRLLAALSRHLRLTTEADVITLWLPHRVDLLHAMPRAFLPRPARTHFVVWPHPDLDPDSRRALLSRRAWSLAMGDYFDI